MLRIKVIMKEGENKIFDVDSDTMEKAKIRILVLYPKAKRFELISGTVKKEQDNNG